MLAGGGILRVETSMKKQIICVAKSPAQTRKLGELLAKTILERGVGHRACVLPLIGDLGAGKSHFAQGFAKGVGIKTVVNSPTFAIMKKYPLKNRGGFGTFYHIDCYRLELSADLALLGIAEILNDPANIVAIEWPDIAMDILPKDILKINFEVAAANSRRIVFEFLHP